MCLNLEITTIYNGKNFNRSGIRFNPLTCSFDLLGNRAKSIERLVLNGIELSYD